MINPPLDAPTDFIPADDERPAGEWMEGYWVEIALWAKRLAFVTWAYFGCMTYMHFKRMTAIMLVFYIPIAVLGYFCFRFAEDLKSALAGQDQHLLEKSFQQLHRLLIWGLIIACFWVVGDIGDWYTTVNIMSEYGPGQFLNGVPLQSE